MLSSCVVFEDGAFAEGYLIIHSINLGRHS